VVEILDDEEREKKRKRRWRRCAEAAWTEETAVVEVAASSLG
jgi:hypothetical protein